MNIGLAIRRERYARGILLKELAAASGIDAPPLSNIERGKTDPSFRTLLRVAKALGTTPGDLIERASRIPATAKPTTGQHARSSKTAQKKAR